MVSKYMAEETTTLPLSSVIVSVYAGNNAEEFKHSLLSITGQDYPHLEIVLVFDGPVPKDILDAVEETRKTFRGVFKTLSLPENKGLGPALNAAIREAKGEFLVRMDSDDYSYPDRIRAQVEFMLQNQDVDVAGCLMEDVFLNGEHYVLPMPLTHDKCVAAFAWRHPINHPTAVFRRRFFEKAGHYPENARLDEDSALWLSAMKSGCIFANLDAVKYKRSIDDRFFRRRKSFTENFIVLKTRLRIVSQLNYGIKGYMSALTRFLLTILPASVSAGIYRLRIHLSNKRTQ